VGWIFLYSSLLPITIYYKSLELNILKSFGIEHLQFQIFFLLILC
jgi:hypothetical protein